MGESGFNPHPPSLIPHPSSLPLRLRPQPSLDAVELRLRTLEIIAQLLYLLCLRVIARFRGGSLRGLRRAKRIRQLEHLQHHARLGSPSRAWRCEIRFKAATCRVRLERGVARDRAQHGTPERTLGDVRRLGMRAIERGQNAVGRRELSGVRRGPDCRDRLPPRWFRRRRRHRHRVGGGRRCRGTTRMVAAREHEQPGGQPPNVHDADSSGRRSTRRCALCSGTGWESSAW